MDARAVHNRNKINGVHVTTAFQPEAKPASRATIAILGASLIGVLLLAGITFFALAIAAPVALAVVQTLPLLVSASDVAIATQLGTIWPVFTVASIASLVAALVVMVKLIERLSPPRSA
jgi:hypothetical protein